MHYWSCIEQKGVVYSSCGLANICCLFGKSLNDELFPLAKPAPGLLKKRLPSNTIKPKKKPKKVLRSRDFDDILNNQLTNRSRPSRRRPTLSTNKNQNSLLCGRRGDKGELYHWHVSLSKNFEKRSQNVCTVLPIEALTLNRSSSGRHFGEKTESLHLWRIADCKRIHFDGIALLHQPVSGQISPADRRLPGTELGIPEAS